MFLKYPAYKLILRKKFVICKSSFRNKSVKYNFRPRVLCDRTRDLKLYARVTNIIFRHSRCKEYGRGFIFCGPTDEFWVWWTYSTLDYHSCSDIILAWKIAPTGPKVQL